MNSCAVCKHYCDKKCSLCGIVFYCSREHQKADWKKHKSNCFQSTFKVEENDTLGRHLVASRRIACGEEILNERPLVSGPQQITPPVCLGCYKLLTELNHVECPKCGWPMCSIQCAKSDQHVPECRATAEIRKAKVKIKNFEIDHPSYESIFVLRCILLINYNFQAWEKFNELQSHSAELKLTATYERNRLCIAKFIQDFYKMPVSEEEILRCVGIINTNGHEVPISHRDFVSVYDKASYLEHNCRANCSRSFTNSGNIVIRAAQIIEPGEHLTICYTDPLWGTASRRQHLQATKFFACCCKRCADPTEANTHFSSLKCFTEDCKGFVIPMDPLLEETEWKCHTCQSTPPISEIFKVIMNASIELKKVDKSDLKSCNSYLKKIEPLLHPQHYFLTDVKLAITDILSTEISTLSDYQLSLKLLYCQQLEKLMAALVPAENRGRGLLLFGLHAALVETGRRQMAKNKLDPQEWKNHLLVCRDILAECYRLLRHEADVLPEGQVALQAKKNLASMTKVLQDLQSSIGDNV